MTDQAIVVFPLRKQAHPESGRGYMLAVHPPGGRLASLVSDGLEPPPISGRKPGVLIWEGTIYFEDEDVPAVALQHNHWRGVDRPMTSGHAS